MQKGVPTWHSGPRSGRLASGDPCLLVPPPPRFRSAPSFPSAVRARRAKAPRRAPTLAREVAPVVALGKAECIEIRSRQNAGDRVRERALGIAELIRRMNFRAARRACDVDRRVDPQASNRREHRPEPLPIDVSGCPRNRIGLALFPEQVGEHKSVLRARSRAPRADASLRLPPGAKLAMSAVPTAKGTRTTVS